MLNRLVLSQAEISDRLEIQQLLVDYSTAIDSRRFDDLDAVFTPTLISTNRQIKGTCSPDTDAPALLKGWKGRGAIPRAASRPRSSPAHGGMSSGKGRCQPKEVR